MSDDGVDHDLLEFMTIHANGNSMKSEVQQTTGVVESAGFIFDVNPFDHVESNLQNALDVSISRDGCIATAEKVYRLKVRLMEDPQIPGGKSLRFHVLVCSSPSPEIQVSRDCGVDLPYRLAQFLILLR